MDVEYPSHASWVLDCPYLQSFVNTTTIPIYGAGLRQAGNNEDAFKRPYDAIWAFAYGPLRDVIAFITLAQIYLWWTVRQIEKRVQRSRSFDIARHQTSQSRSMSKEAESIIHIYCRNSKVLQSPYNRMILCSTCCCDMCPFPGICQSLCVSPSSKCLNHKRPIWPSLECN